MITGTVSSSSWAGGITSSAWAAGAAASTPVGHFALQGDGSTLLTGVPVTPQGDGSTQVDRVTVIDQGDGSDLVLGIGYFTVTGSIG